MEYRNAVICFLLLHCKTILIFVVQNCSGLNPSNKLKCILYLLHKILCVTAWLDLHSYTHSCLKLRFVAHLEKFAQFLFLIFLKFLMDNIGRKKIPTCELSMEQAAFFIRILPKIRLQIIFAAYLLR